MDPGHLASGLVSWFRVCIHVSNAALTSCSLQLKGRIHVVVTSKRFLKRCLELLMTYTAGS